MIEPQYEARKQAIHHMQQGGRKWVPERQQRCIQSKVCAVQYAMRARVHDPWAQHATPCGHDPPFLTSFFSGPSGEAFMGTPAWRGLGLGLGLSGSTLGCGLFGLLPSLLFSSAYSFLRDVDTHARGTVSRGRWTPSA